MRLKKPVIATALLVSATVTTMATDMTAASATSAYPILQALPSTIQLVSASTSGGHASDNADTPVIDASGRYVAFTSRAGNLVSGDTNDDKDVFVRDVANNTTIRASVGSTGYQANSDSWSPAISADGRYVAFTTSASNIGPGDTNTVYDVLVRDLVNNTTTTVSVNASGAVGNLSSYAPAISANGRYVVFESYAKNLVANDTNNVMDVFVRDLVNKTTTRVSLGQSNAQGNGKSAGATISADGRYVVFESTASNLVANDTNAAPDVFVRDLVNNTTTLVSAGSAGTPANGWSENASISGNGRYVAFDSAASNLVANDTNAVGDIFVRDLVNKSTTVASVGAAGAQGNAASSTATLSTDGRYVAFASVSTNLVPDDTGAATDVFVRDLMSQSTRRISVSAAGQQGDNSSFLAAMSGNGKYVAFQSAAANLVPNDSYGYWDVFWAPVA